MTEAIRFFRAVGLTDAMLAFGLATAVIVSGATIVMNGGYTSGALAPIFLLQALASASGFLVPARRGYYDLLLTSSGDRILIGITHWGISAAPGIVCWVVLAGIEHALGGRASMSLAPGTIVGMVLISTLPWAITVPLPRLTGGVAWLTIGALVVSIAPGQLLPSSAHDGFVARTLTILICPWLLVGRELIGVDLAAATAATVVSLAMFTSALLWIDRADIPLEAAQ